MRKALFLDRDGVINIDSGYVYRPDQVVFVDGVFDLCQLAKQKDFFLIVITNQSGIARGYYSEEDFHQLMLWMGDVFSQSACKLDAIYHCPYYPEHEMRKPNPGMILKAAKDFNLDLNSSVMIGDSLHDMEAARRASVGQFFLHAPMGVNMPEAYFGIQVDKLEQIKSYL